VSYTIYVSSLSLSVVARRLVPSGVQYPWRKARCSAGASPLSAAVFDALQVGSIVDVVASSIAGAGCGCSGRRAEEGLDVWESSGIGLK